MTPSTVTAVVHDPTCAPRTVITLLDLVRELGEAGATDREVVAAVQDLVETGRVRLIGQICNEHLLTH